MLPTTLCMISSISDRSANHALIAIDKIPEKTASSAQVIPFSSTVLVRFFLLALQVSELHKTLAAQNEDIKELQETICRLEERIQILIEKLNKIPSDFPANPSALYFLS